ncbi:MAG: phytanoyl-CoA dioxygenase family protein [Candidatus Handelsmanbacteria bacterium]|nr:phytanoyl-CoA dioxygenase family protein [Candidatus Handelsmanbacteria bacterium]
MSEIKSVFSEQGYYLAKAVYCPAEVAELEADFDRIVAQLLEGGDRVNARWGSPLTKDVEAEDSVVLHTHNVQCYSAVWLRALQQERFLAVAQAILGPDVILHHTKLFQKPPEKGAAFPVHQDWQYFPTVEDKMIAGIVHVSAATDQMGCVRVYPGSHRLGRQQGMMGGGQNAELTGKYPLSGATVVEAEPGDVFFFHYFTLHGSMPNTSQALRKTVLAQLHAGDDEVEAGNTHTNLRLTLSGWNHRATRGSTGGVQG